MDSLAKGPLQIAVKDPHKNVLPPLGHQGIVDGVINAFVTSCKGGLLKELFFWLPAATNGSPFHRCILLESTIRLAASVQGSQNGLRHLLWQIEFYLDREKKNFEAGVPYTYWWPSDVAE
jgi:hypothetical protein